MPTMSLQSRNGEKVAATKLARSEGQDLLLMKNPSFKYSFFNCHMETGFIGVKTQRCISNILTHIVNLDHKEDRSDN